ncbi:YkvA family protein [Deinococcus altitudinis]|uniref:YkvA family protein n=1 Tax=Deinococcus altitudinis TaxID=468914 RepID=UPI0038923177
MTRSIGPQKDRPVAGRPGVFSRFVPARLRNVWRDALSLLLALGDRRTPALARLIAVGALLYTVSPIDLIPDGVPFIGYGDDLLIVPALLALAARSLPPEVLALSRFRADQVASRRRWLVPVILGVAVLLSLALAYFVLHAMGVALGNMT